MGRKLPDPIIRKSDESDEDFAVRQASSKRRLQIFKRIYQNYYHWQSQREAGNVSDILTIEGEDFYLGDLLIGWPTLPPQQQKAFDLICLRGYTENAATKEILPKSRWSTPVQQYSDDGLKKMVAAYDAKQIGAWDPVNAVKKKRRVKPKDKIVTPTVEPTPEVPEVAEDAPYQRRRVLDWTVSSDDNKSLAAYIKAETGLEITGEMVKAVAFLHKPWYRSPEQVEHRKAVQEAKDIEKAKFAYETPEQREKRFEATRRLKAAETAAEKARKLQEEVRELRLAAGLDPDTGEPLAS